MTNPNPKPAFSGPVPPKILTAGQLVCLLVTDEGRGVCEARPGNRGEICGDRVGSGRAPGVGR